MKNKCQITDCPFYKDDLCLLENCYYNKYVH